MKDLLIIIKGSTNYYTDSSIYRFNHEEVEYRAVKRLDDTPIQEGHKLAFTVVTN